MNWLVNSKCTILSVFTNFAVGKGGKLSKFGMQTTLSPAAVNVPGPSILLDCCIPLGEEASY